MSINLLMRSAAAGLLALALGSAGIARADAVDKIGKDLVGYEAEVGKLRQHIEKPDKIFGKLGRDLASRRLIDAEVNFGVGNYDDAAVVLYDLVEKYPSYQGFDEALYYLAESLFMKGDFVASRGYFTKLVKDVGPRSKFYQQGLERLIELTLKLNDQTGVDEWMQLLEAVPEAERRSSVPYVRGKFYYFTDKFDDAIAQFDLVVEKSDYYFQARYFAGAALIAKKDLARAAEVFEALVAKSPKNADDRRVAELSQLALGRLHYERDQPSKAAGRYLKISRKSDLFDDALFEVAWVYVKNKEFDKALRALELLSVQDPTSNKLPDVKILEGNLRIRKARAINDAGIGSAAEEYDKADVAFALIHDTFLGPRADLDKIIESKEDPKDFLTQIVGRESEAFTVKSTMPEVSAAWLREEPEVKRIVGVESNLGEIDDNIKDADKTILRIARAVETPSKVNIFPELAEKRNRSIEILETLFGLRTELAAHERAIIAKYADAVQQAELARLQAEREKVARELDALPNSDLAEGKRIEHARGDFVTLDQRAAEVATVIGSDEAQLVALEKYLADTQAEEIKPEDRASLKADIAATRTDVDEMKKQLAALRDEMILAEDQAGTGDEVAEARRTLRLALRKALYAEHEYMSQLIGSITGDDRAKAEQIDQLTDRMNTVTNQLDAVNTQIDAVVDQALLEVKHELEEIKANLVAYRGEFLTYEGDSRGLGGEVLAMALTTVSKKFYEILIRSDVGAVDVAWAMKEAADQDSRRLTLDQSRERRTLDTEFSDTLKEAQQAAEQGGSKIEGSSKSGGGQ